VGEQSHENRNEQFIEEPFFLPHVLYEGDMVDAEVSV
jgi:hypothetical protein